MSVTINDTIVCLLVVFARHGLFDVWNEMPVLPLAKLKYQRPLRVHASFNPVTVLRTSYCIFVIKNKTKNKKLNNFSD